MSNEGIINEHTIEVKSEELGELASRESELPDTNIVFLSYIKALSLLSATIQH